MAAQAAATTERKSKTEDAREFIELLESLTNDEKNQVKGIMIGMQMMRDQLAAFSA